jgi:V-type H+-transporting ATPase subunit H
MSHTEEATKCSSLHYIVSSETTPLQFQQLTPFLNALASLVQGTSSNKRDVAVQCLEALLARRQCRRAVWDIPGIIAGYVMFYLEFFLC